ncbi:MAG TPA: DNA-formamidopyrimidine glycosylase family protein [Candidatus Didemnitutus sp.]
MPELPDITVYLEALERRVVGQVLEKIQILDLFVLRTARPPIGSICGERVRELRRLGKRIAFGFADGKWLVLHLMIAGRLQWAEAGGKAAKGVGRNALAQFTFPTGTLTLTEAGTKRRASLHLLADESELAAHDRRGIDVFGATGEEFQAALVEGNHTLKRALTDPRHFSGIGNAYSDEILHAARLSPVTLAQRLSRDEVARLHTATKKVLSE